MVNPPVAIELASGWIGSPANHASPFFFVDGHAISGGVGLAGFKKLIEAALKEAAGRR
jgi:hypothetical protein